MKFFRSTADCVCSHLKKLGARIKKQQSEQYGFASQSPCCSWQLLEQVTWKLTLYEGSWSVVLLLKHEETSNWGITGTLEVKGGYPAYEGRICGLRSSFGIPRSFWVRRLQAQLIRYLVYSLQINGWAEVEKNRKRKDLTTANSHYIKDQISQFVQ